MMDIDEALRQLAEAPMPPGLERLDEAVFARVDERDRRAPGGIAIIAAVGAVTMGVASAGMPVGTASAATILSPFGAAAPLTPSTLLLGGQ